MVNEATMPYEELPTKRIHLVPREPEWQLLRKQIDARRSDPQLPNSIINLIGTAGIGKSTLVNDIYIQKLNKEYPEIPYALVDYEREKSGLRYLDSEDGSIKVLEDWVADLAKETQTPFPEFEKVLRAFYHFLDDSKQRQQDNRESLLEAHQNQVAEAFVDYLDDILSQPKKKPLVLLIDTAENIPPKSMAWLEERIFEPAISTGFVLCVLASRQQMKWRLFDVRRRVLFHPLKTFNKEQVAEQLGPSYSYLTPNIIKLSFGLPAATAKIAEEISQIEELEQQSPEELIGSRLKRLVEEGLLEQLLYGDIMYDVPDTLREALLVISPLRHFTVNVIAEILPDFSPAYQNINSGIETLAVIRDMMNTTLVDWNREKRGYILDVPLRKIMALALMVRDQQKFYNLHTAVANLYASWIDTDGQENRKDYIIEYLYHQAYALQEQRENEIADKLSVSLKEWIQKYYIIDGTPDVSALDELYKQLESDDGLQDELEEIAPGAFVVIQDSVKAA